MKLFQAIAQNSRTIVNPIWQDASEARLIRILDCLPSGSGFDGGTILHTATDYKIVLKTAFHHMNDAGFYAGWSEHKITVKPCFSNDFEMTISGRDKNGIKEYIQDVFSSVLSSDFDWINP